MKKAYITRKNLIAFGIAILFSLLFFFVGLSITADEDSFLSTSNVFMLMAQAFGFARIEVSGASGMVSVAIAALYITVIVIAIVYIKRFQVMNMMKPTNPKIIGAYILSVAGSLALSAGIIVLLNLNDLAAIGLTMTLIGETALITVISAIVIALFVLAICFIAVNFKKVNKPYEFFDDRKFDDLGEISAEDESSVTSNFDSDDVKGSGSVVGSGDGSGNGTLSDGGARELDDREKVFPGLSRIDMQYDGYSIDTLPTDEITLPDLVERFRNYLAKVEKLYYDIDTLRIFIAGLYATRLSILEGLSGTGKSSLPRYFAKFVNAEVTFLPVQVSWRDKTSILGYFNDFSKIYNETDFLLKLYEASYNPDKIQIFVLDEMNISRVEYYFADFLSVLEYPSDQWKIRILQLPYGFVPPSKLEDGFVTIPENSFFVGTANKDDSTFSIADKVYDRSTVISFDNKNDAFEVKGIAEPITLSYSKLKLLFEGAINDESNKLTNNDYEKLFKVTDYIYEQFEVAFGNRVLNQIGQLVPIFVASGGKKENALDFILAKKVLIKLEGRFEEYVKPALKNLLELIDETYGQNEFNLSRKAINSLIRKL